MPLELGVEETDVVRMLAVRNDDAGQTLSGGRRQVSREFVRPCGRGHANEDGRHVWQLGKKDVEVRPCDLATLGDKLEVDHQAVGTRTNGHRDLLEVLHWRSIGWPHRPQ